MLRRKTPPGGERQILFSYKGLKGLVVVFCLFSKMVIPQFKRSSSKSMNFRTLRGKKRLSG